MDPDRAAREPRDESTPPHGDPLMARGQRPAEKKKHTSEPPATRTDGIESVPSSGEDEPERMGFSDPLPVRSHSLDPSVPDAEESREQAPPTPEWLEPE